MRLLIVISSLLFLGCSIKSGSEIVSMNGIEIEKLIAVKLEKQSGKKFEPLKKIIWVHDASIHNGFRQADSIVAGLQIPFVRSTMAMEIVRRNSDQIGKNGNYIFLKNLEFDKSGNSYYDIAIVQCSDQFELVKYMHTNGLNYNVTNEQIIERLRKWNMDSPFKIITADEDRIEADFIQLPKDLNKFASDIYSFCPDVIDQGAGSEENLIKYFKTEKSFWLWWD
jgi:hypothetical protein